MPLYKSLILFILLLVSSSSILRQFYANKMSANVLLALVTPLLKSLVIKNANMAGVQLLTNQA